MLKCSNTLYFGNSRCDIHCYTKLYKILLPGFWMHLVKWQHYTIFCGHTCHTLPVKFLIDFKVLLLAFKILNNLAHASICELLTHYEIFLQGPNNSSKNILASLCVNLSAWLSPCVLHRLPLEFSRLQAHAEITPDDITELSLCDFSRSLQSNTFIHRLISN